MNNNQNIGAQMIRNMSRYTEDVTAEVRQAVRKVQRDMLPEITAATPIRSYPWNHGVRRYKLSKGHYIDAPAEEQPGAMRSGWVTATLKNTDTRYIVGVRNKARAHVVHLVNFGHDMYTHDHRIVGRVQGNDFVDRVEENAVQRLDGEINRILGGG